MTMDMLQGMANRLPAVVVNAIHQAVYRGSTYAFLALLAGCIGSLFDLNSHTLKQ